MLKIIKITNKSLLISFFFLDMSEYKANIVKTNENKSNTSLFPLSLNLKKREAKCTDKN